MIFRVEGKNAAVISWPRKSLPKLSQSRMFFLRSQNALKNPSTGYKYPWKVEKTFDFLKKTQEPNESIAVFKSNIKLYYYIRGGADFFWENAWLKTILVFPVRIPYLIKFQDKHLII